MIRQKLQRILWRGIKRFAPPEMVVALQYRQTALSSRRRAFPPKNMVVTDHVPAGSVLVMAPHPDDEIIGPGGALCLHLQQGDHVTVLYLTDGRGMIPSDTSLVEVRRQEARHIGKSYGFEQIFWDIPDTTLSNDPKTVEQLTAVLKDLQPDFIYLPSFFDRQDDHFGANKLLANTIRQLKPARAIILGYEVWDNISFPNFLVDISETFDKKASMMTHYQTPMATADFITLFRHRNALHYSLFVDSSRRKPEGYAEAFYRLDTVEFVTLFDKYSDLLATNHHPLVTAVNI